ncbi:hypothetical protein [Streptomyces virginiae]|uniref:hypothetical protein n=1 Tax=Streptomyces virginiae TaxID=1961 RepID=UPI002F91518B|nr:hypothetical protein OG253_41680 [Streptomyces virginiae]
MENYSHFGLLGPMGEAARTDWMRKRMEESRRSAREVAGDSGSVFLAGAPVAGLGSPRSDIDLFVVSDSITAASSRQIGRNGARFDVEFIRSSEFYSLVQQACSFDVCASDASQLGRMPRARLDLVTRFLLSEIVVDEDGRLAQLHAELVANRESFDHLSIARHAQDVQNMSEDVAGALLNGDIMSAVHQSRQMVLRGAEAYLASKGDPYLGEKWVFAKWRRTVATPAANLLHLLQGIPSRTPDESHRAVLEQCWVSQDLTVMAATGYSYDPISSPKDVVRGPHWSVLPWRDGLLVTQREGQGVALSREGLLLWAVAHGRSKGEAIKLARSLYVAKGVIATVSEVARYYDGILSAGLICNISDQPDSAH